MSTPLTRVLILVATRTEAQHLPAQSTLVTGVGAARACAALDAALDERRPELVVSAGFAGALDPALKVGDVVRPSRLIDERGGERSLASGDGRTLITLGRVASVDDKRRLFASTAAHAVDMESFALAQRAAEHKVRFAVIRAISDPADLALPPESIDWVNADGTPGAASVIRWAGLNPRRYALLLRLKAHAELASRRIAEAVTALTS